jgi:hypothetical protein
MSIRPAGREAELSLEGRRAQEPGGRDVLTPAAAQADSPARVSQAQGPPRPILADSA